MNLGVYTLPQITGTILGVSLCVLFEGGKAVILRGVHVPHSLRITGLRVNMQTPFFGIQGPPLFGLPVPAVALPHLTEGLLSIYRVGETETHKTLSFPFIKAGVAENVDTENKQQIHGKNNI